MVESRRTKVWVHTGRAPFKFWSRFRLRFRRRRLLLTPNLNDSQTSFIKEVDYADGLSSEVFDLRRITGEKEELHRLARNWALAGTGRWCRVAGSNLLLKGVVGLKRKGETGSDGKREQGDEPSVKKTARSLAVGKLKTLWSFKTKIRRVKIGSWVPSKGKRASSRKALILVHSEDEDDHRKQRMERRKKIECCFGCGGPSMWRYKERKRNEVDGVVTLPHRLKTKKENFLSPVDGTPTLPDDILEMCLARVPFVSLMRAKAVCKKWKALSSTPHFLQLRERIFSPEPWLFLFGLSRDGVCLGEIQALDPTANTWHTIKAEPLTGRLLYSVTAISSSVYVIGGCSTNSLSGSSRSDKSTVRTLKSVDMYTPITGSWKKVCPMTTERASPIVGVFPQKDLRTGGSGREIGHRTGRGHMSRVSDPFIEFQSLSRRQFRQRSLRRGGELAVFEGTDNAGEANNPGLSGQYWGSRIGKYDEGLEMPWINSRRDRLSKEQRRFGLIAVGGHGKWTEQLDSAEIYDPLIDRWREIASLPADHGAPCAGVVCKNSFYVYSQSNKLAAYDLEHEHWRSIRVSQGPSRLLDYTPKLVSCKGRVFLFGVAWGVLADGGSEMATRKIWELYQEPTFVGWVKVSQHPDAPLDWNAVFVADDEKIYGVEMFKIFGQMLDFVTICKLSGSEPMIWERVSRMQTAMHAIDPSSNLTKTAAVVHL
ncbi:hypothetical protein R1sor_002571 [Riccia sorocarpa]|uniref:F-box domain-containing protein n=1 Tax=Riccia sorocarpa TaxID=122646 RepID=A0ABD3H348_9MARC